MRSVLCICLPRLSTDRVARTDARLRRLPFALITETRGTRRIVACSVHAERAGIHNNMTLAQARAIEPQFIDLPHRPEDDARELAAIATILTRYAPIVSIYDSHTLALDTTGCAPLFDNLQNLAKLSLRDIARRGYTARAAFAPGPTAARALAFAAHGYTTIIEPGHELEALSNLPPGYLGISAEAQEKLNALGIVTIEQLVYLPRGALTARVGTEVLLQLDRALGKAPDPLPPFRAVELPIERIEPPAPVSRPEMATYLLKRLAEGIAAQLEAKLLGARKLECKIERPGGLFEVFTISLSEPRRESGFLFSLLQNRFERVDLGAEIVSLQLRVADGEKLQFGESALFTDRDPAARQDLRSLLDRLVARLGERSVGIVELTEDYRPERAYRLRPPKMENAPVSENITKHLKSSPRMRPLRLFQSPQPVELKLNDSGEPVLLRSGNVYNKVAHAFGPEAISAGWWNGQAQDRYYWILEQTDGARLWVYCNSAGDGACVHGEFS